MRDQTRSQLPDADMQAVPAGLRRAAERAREIASQTGTPLIVVRHGVLTELDPDAVELHEASLPDLIHDGE